MIEVQVSSAAAAFMMKESQARLPNETGGILIGSTTRESINIVHAVGPGPRAIHGRCNFTRDGEFAQEALDRLASDSYGPDAYLGEWHSHTRSVGPSGRDYDSMLWISTNESYALPTPILVICRLDRRCWRIDAFLMKDAHLVSTPVIVEQGSVAPIGQTKQPGSASRVN